jgi:hypothetical protein
MPELDPRIEKLAEQHASSARRFLRKHARETPPENGLHDYLVFAMSSPHAARTKNEKGLQQELFEAAFPGFRRALMSKLRDSE